MQLLKHKNFYLIYHENLKASQAVHPKTILPQYIPSGLQVTRLTENGASLEAEACSKAQLLGEQYNYRTHVVNTD